VRALVVYEAQLGCTKAIAEAIADGLQPSLTPCVVPLADARHQHLGRFDLLVVGDSDPDKRHTPALVPRKRSERALHDHSLSKWLARLACGRGTRRRPFCTRLPGPAAMSGRAARVSSGIASELRRHGFLVVTDPLSCLVDGYDELLPAEADRASAGRPP